LLLIASGVVANIFGFRADNWGVYASLNGINNNSGRVAQIISAGIVIIAKVFSDLGENTSSRDITGINCARVFIIARRIVKRHAFSSEGIRRISQDALVGGTSVHIVALNISKTLGLRRAKISALNISRCRDAQVRSAKGIDGDWLIFVYAAGERIAFVELAQVRGVIARGIIYVDTLGGQRLSWYHQDASFTGAHVEVVAINIGNTLNGLRAKASFCGNNAHSGIAAVGDASGSLGHRYRSLYTSNHWIAVISETQIRFILASGSDDWCRQTASS